MKRPAIEGMPTDRPICPFCNKPLRPCVEVTYDTSQRPQVITARRWYGWQGYPNIRSALFCTLRCALAFAMSSHRAGYRIVRGS